jgi:hypothetical protein
MVVSAVPTAWHGPYLKPPVDITHVDTQKGNTLTVSRTIASGETIFTEIPLVSSARWIQSILVTVILAPAGMRCSHRHPTLLALLQINGTAGSRHAIRARM